MRSISLIALLLLFANPGGADEAEVAEVVEEAVAVAAASAPTKLLHISGVVDGTGRFVVTRDGVRYEHKLWQAPTRMSFDGAAWDDLKEPPAAWRETARKLDLTRAWVVERSGRDSIAMETTADGFDVYVADGLPGAARYSITIAIPRRAPR